MGEEIRLKYVVDIRDVPLPAGVTLAKELDTALADADVRVVVETIGGKGIAYQYTRRALEAGRHVVSSNKELVATHGDELIPLARQKGVRYLYEAAVGGGIPVLFPIYELLCASPHHAGDWHCKRHHQLYPHAHERGERELPGGAGGSARAGLSGERSFR